MNPTESFYTNYKAKPHLQVKPMIILREWKQWNQQMKKERSILYI